MIYTILQSFVTAACFGLQLCHHEGVYTSRRMNCMMMAKLYAQTRSSNERL